MKIKKIKNKHEEGFVLVVSLLILAVSIAIGPYPRSLQVATITFEGYDRMPMDTVRIAKQEDGQWILDNGENVLRLHPIDAGKVLLPFVEIN